MKPFGEIEHAHREGKLRGFKHYHAVAFAISGRSIADERKMLSPRGGVFFRQSGGASLEAPFVQRYDHAFELVVLAEDKAACFAGP